MQCGKKSAAKTGIPIFCLLIIVTQDFFSSNKARNLNLQKFVPSCKKQTISTKTLCHTVGYEDNANNVQKKATTHSAK